MGSVESMILFLIVSGPAEGFCESTSAAAPATCGVAMEVPLKLPVLPLLIRL